MRIMNTPTADKNPIASGDTKRKRKTHTKKQSCKNKTCKSFIIYQDWSLINTTKVPSISKL